MPMQGVSAFVVIPMRHLPGFYRNIVNDDAAQFYLSTVELFDQPVSRFAAESWVVKPIHIWGFWY